MSHPPCCPGEQPVLSSAIDPLLLSVLRVNTASNGQRLTNATGFLFRRGERLFVVTSRHVVLDEASGHTPERLHLELHVDAADMARVVDLQVPLYDGQVRRWREAVDGGGPVDVAVIELAADAVPAAAVYRAFTLDHLLAAADDRVPIGSSLLVVGFPLGFHDTLHHLPVVRGAAVASSFGLRFQGKGWFLTDARTHRGISGAPVVMRDQHAGADSALPWRLLGVHSARLDVGSRDLDQDEALGLNCAWYADILRTLTER